jgi:hypothetical protein
MRTRVSVTLVLCFLFLSCTDNVEVQSLGLLEGTIGIYEGDCMPSPEKSPCVPSPFSTMILITNPSEHYNRDLMVDSVGSDANGKYSIYLPEGKYSLFLRDGNEIICDSWTSDGQNTYCLPFEIKKDSVTVMNANIDHATW